MSKKFIFTASTLSLIWIVGFFAWFFTSGEKIFQLQGLRGDGDITGSSEESLYVRNEDNLYVKAADSIVIGKIKQVRSPSLDTVTKNASRDVVLSVERYLKNPLSSNELIIKLEGGELNGSQYIVEGQPTFSAGEQVLLFLGHNEYGQVGVYGGENGKYVIDEKNAIIHGPNKEIRSLTAFEDEIQNVLKSLRCPPSGDPFCVPVKP